jgi:hypothetical protein
LIAARACITVYSLYPKLGMMFERSQDYDFDGPIGNTSGVVRKVRVLVER